MGMISDSSAEVPYCPIFGNHERRNEEGITGADIYSLLFSLPDDSSGSELFYSFNYGAAHFVVLDTNEDIEPGTEQDLWLRADLEAANADENILWKFAFHHHPPYCSSIVGIGDEQQISTRRFLPPIYEEYGVNIVFTGHQHVYERSYKDGVYYIVTGNGGALPGFAQLPVLNQYSQFFEGNPNFHAFGFCHIDIAGDYLILQSVLSDGTVIDVLELGEVPIDDDTVDDDVAERQHQRVELHEAGLAAHKVARSGRSPGAASNPASLNHTRSRVFWRVAKASGRRPSSPSRRTTSARRNTMPCSVTSAHFGTVPTWRWSSTTSPCAHRP